VQTLREINVVSEKWYEQLVVATYIAIHERPIYQLTICHQAI